MYLFFFSEDISHVVLSSVMEYAGLVDANALSFLWPTEFNEFRICVISGGETSEMPMITVFHRKVIFAQ